MTLEEIKQKIVDILKESMEDTEFPNKVMEVLKENEGKRVDMKLMGKLNKTLDRNDFHISKSHNLTYVRTGLEENSRKICLIVSYATTYVKVNTKFIHDSNLCYYDAASDRNKNREMAIRDESALSTLASAICQYQQSKKVINNFMSYGSPFHDDVYGKISKLIGN